MTINKIAPSHVTRTPAEQHAQSTRPPAWLRGLEKLMRAESDNLDHYELVGPNSSDAGSAKGKATIAHLPKAVRDFFEKQQGVLPDNDGTVAICKFPLSEVSPSLKGSAWGIRWVSENQLLDRMYVFDSAGHGLAKGWTDNGGAYSFTAAKGPFTIDDTPHTTPAH